MSTNNEELGSLDEIDIDAILNESIGTTGKPDVPSAYEALPSFLEDDLVDIESLLAETAALDNYNDNNNVTELSLADTVEVLRPSGSEPDGLVLDEADNDVEAAAETDVEAAVQASVATEAAADDTPFSATDTQAEMESLSDIDLPQEQEEAAPASPNETLATKADIKAENAETPTRLPEKKKAITPPKAEARTKPASTEELGSLDEIDIDAILNESIGTSGKPDVPSAYEALPSFLEDDLVDIESLLAETAALDNHNDTSSVTELSLADTVELLRSSGHDLDEVEAADTDTLAEMESLSDIDNPEDETALASESETLATTAEPAFVSEMQGIITQPDDEARIKLSELLKKESDTMDIGPVPIPELPDALPASSTRRFRTRPKRPLTYLQKRACVYASGIIIWSIISGQMAWNTYQRHLALSQPPLPPVKVAKIIPPAIKPAPQPKKAAPHKHAAAAAVATTASADGETLPHVDGEPKKAGSGNFEPIQCNIQMDSKNLREEIRKCLQMVKMQH